MSFLKGVQSGASEVQLCLALEHVYNLSANCVLPLGFTTNLMSYFQTGSKFVCDMLGHCGPHGSYKTVHRWIENKSEHKLLCPTGDIIVAFDNDQAGHKAIENHIKFLKEQCPKRKYSVALPN